MDTDLTPAEAAVLASLRAGTHVCVPREQLTALFDYTLMAEWLVNPRRSDAEVWGIRKGDLVPLSRTLAAAPEVARDGR